MNETDYFRLSLRERQAHRAKRATYTRSPIFAAPYKPENPQPPGRLRWIEAGHGLRVVPASDIIKLDHNGWFVDQFQDETTVAHIIRLPKGRGFLLAASDPWNDDAFTVENCAPMPAAPVARMHGPPDPDQGTRDAARLAERFAERLAEDYRDDAEHQQALHDQEEAEDERKAFIERHRAQVIELETELGEILDEAEQAQHPAPRARLVALAARKREAAEQSRRLAQEREDADPPEAPTAPNFNYFGKVKR